RSCRLTIVNACAGIVSDQYHFPRLASAPCLVFFANDSATTEIYTLSLHDALPIWPPRRSIACLAPLRQASRRSIGVSAAGGRRRSEEHTSELQSLTNLGCPLLLEKKKHPR